MQQNLFATNHFHYLEGLRSHIVPAHCGSYVIREFLENRVKTRVKTYLGRQAEGTMRISVF